MAGGEQAYPSLPFSAAGGRVLAAPFQFLLTDDDRLRLVTANSVASVIVTVQGYRLDKRGEKHPFAFRHTPNTDRSTKTEDYVLGAGALLNLTIVATGATPLVGQTFVMAQLVRGAGAASIVLGTLLGGYVTSVQHLAWPGSPIVSSTDGEPAVREIFAAVPAVGNDVSESCPTGARWELMTILAGLITDGTAGNRASVLRQIVSGGASPMMVILNPAAGDVPPGSTYTFTWAQNIPPSFRNLYNVTPIPQRPLMRAGSKFTISGQNAGDQWVATVYTVREWLEVS